MMEWHFWQMYLRGHELSHGYGTATEVPEIEENKV